MKYIYTHCLICGEGITHEYKYFTYVNRIKHYFKKLMHYKKSHGCSINTFRTIKAIFKGLLEQNVKRGNVVSNKRELSLDQYGISKQ